MKSSQQWHRRPHLPWTFYLPSCLFIIIVVPSLQLLCLPLASCQEQREQPSLGVTLANSLQHLSKSDIESLLKSYTSDSTEADANVDRLVDVVLSELSSTTARTRQESESGGPSNPFIELDVKGNGGNDFAEGAESINVPLESPNLSSRPVYLFKQLNTSSFQQPQQRQRQRRPSPSYNEARASVNNKKREIDSTKDYVNQHNHRDKKEGDGNGDDRDNDAYHDHHHRQQLPLEKLFPQILTTTHGSVRLTDRRGKQTDPQNKLTSALMNHSIHNEYESDEELDRLVFSQLPQGSKLILRTVKIVKTDEDGNEEPIGDSAVSWDMVPMNATDDEEFDDDGTLVVKPGKKGWNPKRIRKRPEYGFVVKDPLDVESIGRTDDDDEDDEVEAPPVEGRNDKDDDGNEDDHVTEAPGEASVRETHTLMPDQYSAGSHQTTQRHQKYKHGSNEKEKEKTDKYYRAQDHSNENINTKTDTDGKKVTDYEGTEKGLTDYVNAHGKAIHDERERYKNSKKKNKGRKVTGFKRVYHKEEFQRTEHFYDDEEAKRIAESYGLTDQKEKSNHGTKQDKRKYHGTKIEHTDVDKLKKEKITKDRQTKGSHHANDHSDKHKYGQKYSHHQASHTPPTKYGHGSNKKNHYREAQQEEYEQEHPNHNYQAAQYSVPQPQIGELVQYAPAQLVGGFTASSPAFVNKLAQKSPVYDPHSAKSKNQVVAHGSEIESSVLPTPRPMLAKPSEMKIFFAERERKIPDEDAANKYYAPNFGPPYSRDHKLSESEVAALFSSSSDNSTRKLRYPQDDGARYANSYENKVPDPIPEYYSTIQKLTPPLKVKTKGRRGKKLKSVENGNIVDVQQSLGAKVTSEVIYQPPQSPTPQQFFEHQYRQNSGRPLFRTGHRYSTWLPIGSESMTKGINAQPEQNEAVVSNNTDADTSVGFNSNSSSLPNIKPSPQYHTVLNKQLPHLLIAKPMPYRITRPALNRQLAFRPYGAAVPGPPQPPSLQNHGPPHSHYYGATIISQAPSTLLQRIPTYSTHLMNGFVNSMTGVFGRVVGR